LNNQNYSWLHRSSDDGINWETILYTDKIVNDFSIVSDNIVWVAGNKGLIAKSIDGGDNWYRETETFNIEKYNFHMITAIDDTHSWAVTRVTDGKENEKFDAIYKTSGPTDIKSIKWADSINLYSFKRFIEPPHNHKISYERIDYWDYNPSKCHFDFTYDKRNYHSCIRDIAIDKNDEYLYIVGEAYDVGRIKKYTTNGSFVKGIQHVYGSSNILHLPQHISVDYLGNIFSIVRDRGGTSEVYHISKIDIEKNETLNKWAGLEYKTNAELNQRMTPRDITTDKFGNVWILYYNNRFINDFKMVKKFDPNGNLLLEFANNGVSTGQLSDPRKITTDSSGNIHVLDIWHGSNDAIDAGDFRGPRIQTFDQNGNLINTWRQALGKPYLKVSSGSEFNSINGSRIAYEFAVDSKGRIYTLDSDKGIVTVFDNSGNFLSEFGMIGNLNDRNIASGFPTDLYGKISTIVISNSDLIYLADSSNNRIEIFKLKE